MVIPDTKIRLYDCLLTADQENQLTWSSPIDQEAYFDGLPSLTIEGCSYQRENTAIRVPLPIDQVRQYNYCSYENRHYTSRKFYCFITDYQYVNDNMSLIFIETDVWQTWWDRFDFLPSFVEREHVTDDTIGANTFPEDLEYGPYICNNIYELNFGKRSLQYFCMQVTDLPDNHGIPDAELPQRFYNGMPSGCYYLCFERTQWSGMNRWIKAYGEGKVDAILSIFPMTRDLIGKINQNGISVDPVPVTNNIFSGTYIIPDSDFPCYMENATITRQTKLDGYTPKNNKLFVYPYCYLNFMSMTGSTIAFNFEDFEGDPNFRVDGVVTVGGEYKVYPTNYKKSSDPNHPNGGYAFGVNLSSFPQGSWSSDTYQNWRALNSDAITIQTQHDLIQSGISAAGSLLSLNPGQMVGGTLSAVNNASTTIQLANNQRRVAKLAPDQARGDTATKTLTFSEQKSMGAFYSMCIKAEYARIIDDFFSMYGYKVHRLKYPSWRSRLNWNYVKTIGANVTGEVPQKDILAMKQILDRGITFWHNPVTFLDYTQPNPVSLDGGES